MRTLWSYKYSPLTVVKPLMKTAMLYLVAFKKSNYRNEQPPKNHCLCAVVKPFPDALINGA